MNYSDSELSDDDNTQPQPQQGQQNTDQSPSSSTQTTPLGSKGHSTRKCGVQPNRKQKKMSNEPNKKDTKGKRGGSNCSQQQQAVNPSHSPSSCSSSSPTTPKNQKKKKKGSKGNSPSRLDPFSPGANTSNLKVSDPISGLQFAWDDFWKLSKDELKTTAPPKQRPSSSGVNCCARCGM